MRKEDSKNVGKLSVQKREQIVSIFLFKLRPWKLFFVLEKSLNFVGLKMYEPWFLDFIVKIISSINAEFFFSTTRKTMLPFSFYWA